MVSMYGLTHVWQYGKVWAVEQPVYEQITSG